MVDDIASTNKIWNNKITVTPSHIVLFEHVRAVESADISSHLKGVVIRVGQEGLRCAGRLPLYQAQCVPAENNSKTAV